MDIDIIRNQKLGAGAGIRSNKVRVRCCRTDCIMGEHCFSLGCKINNESIALSPSLNAGFKPRRQEHTGVFVWTGQVFEGTLFPECLNVASVSMRLSEHTGGKEQDVVSVA